MGMYSALRDEKDPRLSEACRLFLKDDDPFLRAGAAYEMKLGSDRDVSVLQTMLRSDPDPHVRLWTLVALGRSGHAPPESVLMQMATSDPGPEVRERAALALARSANPPPKSFFLRLLKAEPDEEARSALWELAGDDVLQLAPAAWGKANVPPGAGAP